jgi:hypothetical protein
LIGIGFLRDAEAGACGSPRGVHLNQGPEPFTALIHHRSVWQADLIKGSHARARPVTPFGGLSFLAGWAVLIWAAQGLDPI